MPLFADYESPSAASRAVMAGLDLASVVLAPRRPKPGFPLAPGAVKSLLLLRLDGIGDNVCSWPAIQLLRQGLPGTRITLAVGPWVAPLYRECPWVDEVVAWDSGLFGLFRGGSVAGLKRDWAMTRSLKARGFDAALDLRGDMLSVLPMWGIGAPVRGARLGRGGERLLTDAVTKGEGHESDRVYGLARSALGQGPAKAPLPTDWARPQARARFEKRLGIRLEPGNTAALCPGALWRYKAWPKERFRALADRLKREQGKRIMWFGDDPTWLGPLAGDDAWFCGPLDEAAAGLGACGLAVCNDTGLMHVAVAAGCRTVQLFGPGEERRFGYISPGTPLLLDRECPWHPCVQRGRCANLGRGGWCLEKITVDAVLECARRLTE